MVTTLALFFSTQEVAMRLDKYLKVSRIIKRRTVANDACDTEHVEVNGRRAKASYDVKEGDVIEITFGQKTLKLRVLTVKDNVAKADASGMYEIIE
jgi:ribosomal 50S subunit-recycling heat shock protein